MILQTRFWPSRRVPQSDKDDDSYVQHNQPERAGERGRRRTNTPACRWFWSEYFGYRSSCYVSHRFCEAPHTLITIGWWEFRWVGRPIRFLPFFSPPFEYIPFFFVLFLWRIFLSWSCPFFRKEKADDTKDKKEKEEQEERKKREGEGTTFICAGLGSASPANRVISSFPQERH